MEQMLFDYMKAKSTEAVKPWNKGHRRSLAFPSQSLEEILDREGKLQNRIHENSETSETESTPRNH